MNEIVQIPIKRYKELDSLSKANQREIEKRAYEHYKKLGTQELKIYFFTGSDYDEEVKIDTKVFLYGRDDKLLQDEQIDLFERMVSYNVDELIKNKYGRHLLCLSNIRKKQSNLDNQARNMLATTITGWLVAMIFVIIFLVKN